MEYNTVGEWIGIGILMFLYVWIKVWIYKREYKGDTKDRVIKRGNEWD